MNKPWYSIALSILLPGSGYYLLKRPDKATLILSSFALHISIAYWLLHMVVIEQPLTIVFIMFVIPYHYFYAIYDGVTRRATRTKRKTILFYGTSLFIIMITISLWLPWQVIYHFKELIINRYPISLILLLVSYLLVKLVYMRHRRRYIGRISSALMLSILALVITMATKHQIQWKYWLAMLPVIICTELLIWLISHYTFKPKGSLKLDLWGVCVSAIFVTCSFVVIQYGDYPSKVLQSFHAPIIEHTVLDDESGYSYHLSEIKIPVVEFQRIDINHLNGFVRVLSGDVDEITIYPQLFVNTEDETIANQVKNSSYVDITFHGGITVNTVLPRHSLNHYPRMNLMIVIPDDLVYIQQAYIKVDYGAISVSDLVVSNSIELSSIDAAIHATNIVGQTSVHSKHGNIYLNNIMGDISSETKKGEITIIKANRAVSATSLNGNIFMHMKHFNGPIDLTATIGSITLATPKIIDYSLEANVSFGGITYDDSQRKRTKKLTIPNFLAKYYINLYASNDILIQ